MTAKQSDTVQRLLAGLEKHYSKASLLPDGGPLDQIVYLLIDGVSGKRAAEAGIVRLKKTFVDWNEVRVSSHREIEGCLAEVAKDERQTTANHIKSGLSYIYESRYRDEVVIGNDLENPDTDLEHLAGIEGLDQGRAALVLYSTLPETETVLPFSALNRILTRVGAIKRTTSIRALKTMVEELVDPVELARITYLLARHGHEVCGVKSYYCTQCVAASLCTMGRRRVKSAREAKRARKSKTGDKKAVVSKAAKSSSIRAKKVRKK